MIEYVAVNHPHAWTFVEPYDEAQGLIEGHIDGVLPGERPRRLAVFVEYLKKETVQMDGMGPLCLIRNRPDLCFADGCGEWPKVRHRRVVDAVLDGAVIRLNQGEVRGHACGAFMIYRRDIAMDGHIGLRVIERQADESNRE